MCQFGTLNSQKFWPLFGVGDSDSPSPPSSLLREFSFFNEIQLYERDQQLRDERTNERTNERATTKNARRSFRRARSGRRRALISFASRLVVVVCCFLFLFLRERELEMPKRLSSVFVPLLFSREKTSADQRNRNKRVYRSGRR